MVHRLQRTRLIIAVSILNVMLLAAFIGLRLAQPSDGMRLQPGTPAIEANGVIVTALGEPLDVSDSGLQNGDRVMAIEGRSLESWAENLLCWRPLCAGPKRPARRMGGTLTYAVLRGDQPVDVAVRLGRYPLGANIRHDWGAMVYALALFVTGAFVFFKRPDELATGPLLVAGSAMLGATTWSFGLQALDFVQPPGFWLHQLTTRGVYLLIWASVLHFALLFPNPHRLVRGHRWLVPTLYALPFLVLTATLVMTGLAASGPLDWLARIGLDQNLTVAVYLLLGLVALVTNYRDQPDMVSRQQIRVVVYAFVVNIVAALLLWQIPQLILGKQWFTSNSIAIVGLVVPAALVVSILRYRLWDIDVIINRTAVYGLLSIVIVGLYIAAVGVLGVLFQQRGSLIFSLMATGLVAAMFQPLRESLQRLVNRLMYGERDDPYQVVSRLGHQLQDTAAPEDLLELITRTVAGALRLPYASITALESGVFVTQAEYGIPPVEPFVVPLVYQREVVGQLMAAPRGPHDPLTPPDVRLLEDIAQQAGAVVHAVRLNRDLQRSRERLVITREEERRRLRRDLHDGLGPTLASHTLRLDAILDLIDTDPAQAKQQIEALKSQTMETVADIRRLVYELRPPALDELGLIEAVRTHLLQPGSTHQKPDITLEVPPEGLPLLTAAVEVAAYRIIMESVTNVLRHAGALTCRVRLSVEAGKRSALRVDIVDDGGGLPKPVQPGVGLMSIRERAVELGGECTIGGAIGGGTHVSAILPLDGTGS